MPTDDGGGDGTGPIVVEDEAPINSNPAAFVDGDADTDVEGEFYSSSSEYYTSDSDYETDDDGGQDGYSTTSPSNSSSSGSDDDGSIQGLSRRPTALVEELTPLQGRDIIARTFGEMLQTRQVRRSAVHAHM